MEAQVIWNCDEHNEWEPQRINAHEDAISYCDFINDNTLVTSSYDNTLALWEKNNGMKLNELRGHKHRVIACTVDKRNKKLLSGSWDKTIIYWDAECGIPLWTGEHIAHVTSCHMHPESFLAASGCDDGNLVYWDTRSRQKIHKLNGHNETITSNQFSSDGFNICTTSTDNTACVWDVRTNRKLLKFRNHKNAVTSCAFSNNNRRLVTTSWDKSILVYDVSCGTYRSRGPAALNHHEGCVSFCNFSSDDMLLVSCGYDKIINVWDMVTYSLKNCYKGHKNWIHCCNFSGCNKWLLSGSKEGELRLWSTEHARSYDRKISQHESSTLVECDECGLVSLTETDKQQQVKCVFCRLKKINTDKN